MEVSQIPPEGMAGVRNKTQALYVHTLPVIRYLAEIVSWPQLGMDATHAAPYSILKAPPRNLRPYKQQKEGG